MSGKYTSTAEETNEALIGNQWTADNDYRVEYPDDPWLAPLLSDPINSNDSDNDSDDD